MSFQCIYKKINAKATGKNLGQLLKAKNISVKELCNTLGVSNQSVYKWLHGESLPSLENLYQMSQLFHTSMDSIVVGFDKTEYPLPELYVREE